MSTAQWSLLRNWSNEKQIVVSCGLIVAAASIHALSPSARPYTELLYLLPYPETNGQYLQGADDAFFVLGWLVMLTALRAIVIASVHQIVTRYRLVSGKARTRFAEQSWLLFYYGLSFTLGMQILVFSTYWLDFRQLWSEWPSRQMDGQLKWYFLVQLAFYLQLLLAINLEERRKDYTQMFSHHVITCALMYVCYAYRYTKIGNVILCIMDVVDILLPLAKLIKYLRYDSACNVAFGIFLATWLVARHMIYNSLCWSIFRDVPKVMPYGCYSGSTGVALDLKDLSNWRYIEPFFDQGGTICLDRRTKWVFLSLLLMLQVLSIVWFGMIIKVAYGVLKGGAADDSRSDDEEEETENEEKEHEEDEKCELSRLHDQASDPTHSKPRSSAAETGQMQPEFFQRAGGGRLRMPRSRDRKELIGRVGCNGSL
ncbi:sphingosine N-acyltransferase lag1 [Xylographa soralifera]|nr:sphingosine N-acyltransferase lag1 [Xylographa soralifera]